VASAQRFSISSNVSSKVLAPASSVTAEVIAMVARKDRAYSKVDPNLFVSVAIGDPHSGFDYTSDDVA
jgi:hypothetical protein